MSDGLGPKVGAGNLAITLPMRPKLGPLVILVPWMLCAFGMCAAVQIGVIDEGRWELFPLVVVLFLAGMFALRAVLWQLRGKEVITVTADGVEVGYAGSFWMPYKRIHASELEAIRLEPYDGPRWSQWYGLAGGAICISYLGRKLRAGRSLSVTEAGSVVDRLRVVLEPLISRSRSIDDVYL